jgi:hypothetical protein
MNPAGSRDRAALPFLDRGGRLDGPCVSGALVSGAALARKVEHRGKPAKSPLSGEAANIRRGARSARPPLVSPGGTAAAPFEERGSLGRLGRTHGESAMHRVAAAAGSLRALSRTEGRAHPWNDASPPGEMRARMTQGV